MACLSSEQTEEFCVYFWRCRAEGRQNRESQIQQFVGSACIFMVYETECLMLLLELLCWPRPFVI
jgi:hypothetical protein